MIVNKCKILSLVFRILTNGFLQRLCLLVSLFDHVWAPDASLLTILRIQVRWTCPVWQSQEENSGFTWQVQSHEQCARWLGRKQGIWQDFNCDVLMLRMSEGIKNCWQFFNWLKYCISSNNLLNACFSWWALSKLSLFGTFLHIEFLNYPVIN